MSAASDAMKALTAQYYNALVTQLNLDDQKFQLVQGNVALGSTSQHLWELMDSIPENSIAHQWTPGGQNTYSSQYGTLISRLKDASSAQFVADMGGYYPKWAAYLSANPVPAGQTVVQHFTSWAQSNIADPGKVGQLVSEYAASLNSTVGAANTAFTAAGGQTGVKAYTQTIEMVDNQSASAPSGSVTLDSATASRDTTHTWAKGSVSGFFEAFFAGGGGSYDKQTVSVTSSGLNFQIKFDHVATIAATPLSQGSLFTEGETYQAWYVPAALGLGYGNNNYDTWVAGTPDWTTFFGPQGTFLRATRALIVVNGITISIVSDKSIAEADRTEVTAAFEAGFFPFFGVKGQGGWTSTHNFDDQGRIHVTATCAVGNPQVLGILQSPIGQILSSAKLLEVQRSLRDGSVANAEGLMASGGRKVASGVGMAVQVVHVAWSARALQGLHALGAQPAVEQLIVGFVNAWATNNAPHWNEGQNYQYAGGPPHYVATGQRGRTSSGEILVSITDFQ